MNYKVVIEIDVEAEHVPELLTKMGAVANRAAEVEGVIVTDVRKNTPTYTHRNPGTTLFNEVIGAAQREATKRGL